MSAEQTFALTTEAETQTIEYWGQCVQCKSIQSIEDVRTIADLTIWDIDSLQAELELKGFIHIACLRVYQLAVNTEISVSRSSGFIPLNPVISTINSKKVLSEEIFQRRKQELIDRRPPLHPELIQLERIFTNSEFNQSVEPLITDIHQLLGWGSQCPPSVSTEQLWINKIAEVGNSSDGNEFEKSVRKSLRLLGFDNSINNPKASLDPDATGGAGGLDFYCDTPYSVVGECKATKTECVPDSTPAQLVKLGLKILEEQYNECIKILMVAGKLNSHANKTAIGNRMNVIRPETLQKLVRLKANYPGAIDLLALKPYLVSEPFGEAADEKLDTFITKVIKNLRLRSTIVELVKESLAKATKDNESVEALYSIFTYTQTDYQLSRQEFYNILIELSSPLTGYLGRHGEDRFYFLRSLAVIESADF